MKEHYELNENAMKYTKLKEYIPDKTHLIYPLYLEGVDFVNQCIKTELFEDCIKERETKFYFYLKDSNYYLTIFVFFTFNFSTMWRLRNDNFPISFNEILDSYLSDSNVNLDLKSKLLFNLDLFNDKE